MKKLVYLIFVSALVMACSKDDTSEKPNEAPSTPTLVFPENSKLCIDNSLSFKWSPATDVNNDPLIYQIQVAKDRNFSNIVMTALSTSTYQNFVLEKATAYYWRVKASDEKGLSSSYSAVFSFYTSGKGVVNYLPFLPELVAPDLNSVVNTSTVQLKWTAKDVDVNDKLVYDVYFGTTNPPTNKISTDQAATTYDVVVAGMKEYYWKVNVKDDKGGTTIGQTWRFRTN